KKKLQPPNFGGTGDADWLSQSPASVVSGAAAKHHDVVTIPRGHLTAGPPLLSPAFRQHRIVGKAPPCESTDPVVMRLLIDVIVTALAGRGGGEHDDRPQR